MARIIDIELSAWEVAAFDEECSRLVLRKWNHA